MFEPREIWATSLSLKLKNVSVKIADLLQCHVPGVRPEFSGRKGWGRGGPTSASDTQVPVHEVHMCLARVMCLPADLSACLK